MHKVVVVFELMIHPPRTTQCTKTLHRNSNQQLTADGQGRGYKLPTVGAVHVQCTCTLGDFIHNI